MDLPSCQNLDLETKCSSHAAANLRPVWPVWQERKSMKASFSFSYAFK